MLIAKNNPSGIDWYIQRLQNKLHAELVTAWGLQDDDTAYRCYGRCYRNKKDTGYIAENYEGGGEYRELFWDDSLTALSFFGMSNTPVVKGIRSTADVHLVFFGDLSKLSLKDRTGAAITHRSDEEFRASVMNVTGKFSHGFTYISTELWLENVLKEYAGSYRDQRLKAVDMHPIHCFRMNFKLVFDQNKIC